MSLMSNHDLDDDDDNDGDPRSTNTENPSSPPFKPHRHPDLLDANNNNDDDDDDDDDAMAGIYLGIHNIFATVPQFLATFVSMIVFSILEPGQSPELAAGGASASASASSSSTAAASGGGSGGGEGLDKMAGELPMNGLSGTAVCLAIGAVFQLVAAAQSLRMRRY